MFKSSPYSSKQKLSNALEEFVVIEVRGTYIYKKIKGLKVRPSAKHYYKQARCLSKES